MFLTGYIAGVHFVQTLAKIVAGGTAPALVSVGRTSEGEVEVVEHDTLESAFDHVIIYLYAYAVVVSVESDLYTWHVCRPDVPDDVVARVDMRAVLGLDVVTTSTPMVDVHDGSFHGELFLDGFAAGLDAEERGFKISFGTLDMMASVMLERPTPKELRR